MGQQSMARQVELPATMRGDEGPIALASVILPLVEGAFDLRYRRGLDLLAAAGG